MTLQQLMTILLLVWNGVVFLLYGLDKGKARRQVYRIPEKTLLLSSWILGGVGAWCGGCFFHHKTRKWYFQLTWYVSMALVFVVCYFIWS